MSMDQVAKVEANKFYLPGVMIQIEPKRNYPYGPMFAHVLGYVSEVSPDELKTEDYKNYAIGDAIGKFGLERIYEKYLRGVDGEKRVEVDASGKEIRTLDTKEPVSGNSIYLNVDLNIQTTVDKALEGKKGGVDRLRPPHRGRPRPRQPSRLRPQPAYVRLARILEDYRSPTRPTRSRTGSSRGASLPARPSSRWWRSPPSRKGVINETTTFSCGGPLRLRQATSLSAGRKGGTARWPSIRASSPPATSFSTIRACRTGVDTIHEMADKIGITKPTG